MTFAKPLLYSNKRCQPCIAIKRKLTSKGIDFDEVMVSELDYTEQETARAKLEQDGYSSAPVVYWTDADGVDGSFAGFNVYELEKMIGAYSREQVTA